MRQEVASIRVPGETQPEVSRDKDKTLLIRISAEDLNTWRSAAVEAGLPLSEYIRARVNGDSMKRQGASIDRRTAPRAPNEGRSEAELEDAFARGEMIPDSPAARRVVKRFLDGKIDPKPPRKGGK